MSQKLPEFIRQEDFEKLLEAASRRKVRHAKEYQLAMLLAFEAGMRLSEICGLRPLATKCCNALLAKGKKTDKRTGLKKTVYYCPTCRKICDRNKGARRAVNGSLGWAIAPLQPEQIGEREIKIIAGKGKKDRVVPRPKRLSERSKNLLPLTCDRESLEKFVKNLGKKVLNKSIHFHMFRHGFGSHLAGRGQPLHEIQLLMGHSRLDTTGIYLHANPQEVIKKVRDIF